MMLLLKFINNSFNEGLLDGGHGDDGTELHEVLQVLSLKLIFVPF